MKAIAILQQKFEFSTPEHRAEIIEAVSEIEQLQAKLDKAQTVLQKIARVNAMDYKYQRWAREYFKVPEDE